MTNRAIFGFFDQAYVINLDKDRERLRRFATRSAVIGLDKPIRVRGVTRNPSKKPFAQPGNHGLCALAHVKAWQAVIANGHRHALICEDDALFRDDAGRLLRSRLLPQLATLQRSTQWDIFYLGCSLSQAGAGVSADIGVAEQAGHCFAYAISAAGARKLIPLVKRYVYEHSDFWDSLPFPGLLKLFSTTLLAVQAPGYSETAQKKIDRVYWYFRNGFFDRDDFERHCAEMRSWRKQ